MPENGLVYSGKLHIFQTRSSLWTQDVSPMNHGTHYFRPFSEDFDMSAASIKHDLSEKLDWPVSQSPHNQSSKIGLFSREEGPKSRDLEGMIASLTV
jgi:hypothetical protein